MLWQAVQRLVIDMPYGELLHSVDPHEDNARAPFVVVAVVGAVSLLLSSLLAIVDIEMSGRIATGFLVIPTALVASWGLLGSISVILHYLTHRKFAASVQEAWDALEALELASREAIDPTA